MKPSYKAIKKEMKEFYDKCMENYDKSSHNAYQYDLSNERTFEELREQAQQMVREMTAELKSITPETREMMRMRLGLRANILSGILEQMKAKDPNKKKD